MQQYLTIWDLILTPVYLLVLTGLAKWQRNRLYPPRHPLRPYYLMGLYCKFAGVIFIGLIYQYYYGGGDTYNYLTHAKIINSALDRSFTTWLQLLTHQSVYDHPQLYNYTSQMFWYGEESTYTVSCIAAVFGLFNNTSYMPISLMFAYLSYTGIWAMYRTFNSIYPTVYKQLAWAILFVPSTVVWGSSLFKDTICIFGLGWMTYCTFRLFVYRDLSLRNFIFLCLSFYLVAIVKIYIIMAFVPALGLWLLMTYSGRIKVTALRWIINILFVGAIMAGSIFAARRFANELGAYALDNIAKKAQKTNNWIALVSEQQDGSAYDIGKLDGTLTNMLSKFPQAVNVTLFRPYLWEARKPIILLSALEAAAFLGFTLFLFYRRGIKPTFRLMFSQPTLTFCLIFTLIFAFAVGVTTGNFGSLSRYKIPCIPYFASLLVILYYYRQQKQAPPSKPTNHVAKPVRHFARF